MNKTILFLASLLFICFISTGCFLPYVLKQGYYQAKLLYGRQSIQEVLKQNTLSPKERERLQLILDIKHFASQNLALAQNTNYSTINLAWNHTLYSVSASDPLQFKPYTWWFPIVGNVPYKGFFDKSDAIKEKERLLHQNLDVQMQTISGYSSLGYFSDPIWPQMLDLPITFLVELIIHELAHATIYFKNQTDFNESFANAVGKMGTLTFLQNYFGKNSQEYKGAILIYQDETIYNDAMWKLYQDLDTIYRSDRNNTEKTTFKKQTIAHFIENNSKLPFSTSYFKNRDWNNLNNAFLASFKRYHSEQKNMERLLNHFEHNWHQFIIKICTLENTKNPLASFNQLVDKL